MIATLALGGAITEHWRWNGICEYGFLHSHTLNSFEFNINAQWIPLVALGSVFGALVLSWPKLVSQQSTCESGCDCGWFLVQILACCS